MSDIAPLFSDEVQLAGWSDSHTSGAKVTFWLSDPSQLDAFRGMTERKGILPNLDYPSGPAYHLMGFDTLTFTPLFVAARITGWTAHIMEQAAANALIRPLSNYNGVDERHL